MLRSLLKLASDTVTVDLLTIKDVDDMKRASGKEMPEREYSQEVLNAKRFLILTEETEFDWVHYPLPLEFIRDPPADRMIRTIERMKNELEMGKSQS